MGKISNRIQEKITELVEEVQKELATEYVSGKYMCPEHGFLELNGVEIELEIRKPDSLSALSVWELWKCRECGRIVVKIAADIENREKRTEGTQA